MMSKTPATLTEEDHERAEALMAIAQRADPPRCLCGDEPMAAPALVGYAFGVLKGRGGHDFRRLRAVPERLGGHPLGCPQGAERGGAAGADCGQCGEDALSDHPAMASRSAQNIAGTTGI
jgi:hypothetical protein